MDLGNLREGDYRALPSCGGTVQVKINREGNWKLDVENTDCNLIQIKLPNEGFIRDYSNGRRLRSNGYNFFDNELNPGVNASGTTVRIYNNETGAEDKFVLGEVQAPVTCHMDGIVVDPYSGYLETSLYRSDLNDGAAVAQNVPLNDALSAIELAEDMGACSWAPAKKVCYMQDGVIYYMSKIKYNPYGGNDWTTLGQNPRITNADIAFDDLVGASWCQPVTPEQQSTNGSF
jgi:hypothetical protein